MLEALDERGGCRRSALDARQGVCGGLAGGTWRENAQMIPGSSIVTRMHGRPLAREGLGGSSSYASGDTSTHVCVDT